MGLIKDNDKIEFKSNTGWILPPLQRDGFANLSVEELGDTDKKLVNRKKNLSGLSLKEN